MTKTKTILLCCASALVGLLVGTFVVNPTQGSDSLAGDVGKIIKHKSAKAVNASDLALIENKLKADSSYLTQMTYTLSFISSRISEFKENAALTSLLVADVAPLQSYKQQMDDLTSFATNAQTAAQSALTSLCRVTSAQGAKEASTDASFEELSNNAMLAYMLLEKGSVTTRNFVTDVDAFLKDNKKEDYTGLAYIRDAWVSYNVVDAALNSDKTSISYWDKAGLILSSQESLAMLVMLSECLNSKEFLQSTVNSSFFNSSTLQSLMAVDRVVSVYQQSVNTMNAKFLGSNYLMNTLGSNVKLNECPALNSEILMNAPLAVNSPIVFNNEAALNAFNSSILCLMTDGSLMASLPAFFSMQNTSEVMQNAQTALINATTAMEFSQSVMQFTESLMSVAGAPLIGAQGTALNAHDALTAQLPELYANPALSYVFMNSVNGLCGSFNTNNLSNQLRAFDGFLSSFNKLDERMSQESLFLLQLV